MSQQLTFFTLSHMFCSSHTVITNGYIEDIYNKQHVSVVDLNTLPLYTLPFEAIILRTVKIQK